MFFATDSLAQGLSVCFKEEQLGAESVRILSDVGRAKQADQHHSGQTSNDQSQAKQLLRFHFLPPKTDAAMNSRISVEPVEPVDSEQVDTRMNPMIIHVAHKEDAFRAAFENAMMHWRKTQPPGAGPPTCSVTAEFMHNDLILENRDNTDITVWAVSCRTGFILASCTLGPHNKVLCMVLEKRKEPICLFPSTAAIQDRRDVHRVVLKIPMPKQHPQPPHTGHGPRDLRCELVFEEYVNEVQERVCMIYVNAVITTSVRDLGDKLQRALDTARKWLSNSSKV